MSDKNAQNSQLPLNTEELRDTPIKNMPFVCHIKLSEITFQIYLTKYKVISQDNSVYSYSEIWKILLCYLGVRLNRA